MLGTLQITNSFRESVFPGARDPAGHKNYRRRVTWDRGDQLGEDFKWNPFHGNGEVKG